MTPTELRSSLSLSLIFAMRMLGLFLVLPVFALEAARLPGGDDLALVGLAMGIYGLTQGLLQIPFGMASDRFGRKRVIVFGLLVFALGSFMAMTATTLAALTLGRAVQGAGAISAAVTALLADQTRDEVRTKAMTLLGVSIGFVFALSLIVAPVLNTYIGLPGLFALTAVMALLGIAVVLKITPAEPAQPPTTMAMSSHIFAPSDQRLKSSLAKPVEEMRLEDWKSPARSASRPGMPPALTAAAPTPQAIITAV